MGRATRFRRILSGVSILLAGIAVVLMASGSPEPATAVAVVGSAVGSVGLSLLGTIGPISDQKLIARASHELRTPLTSTIGILDLLVDPDTNLQADESRELLGMAHDDAMHMLHILANLHSASRLAREVLRPNRQPIDPAEIARLALARFPEVARRTYPISDEVNPVWGDAELTRQILTNLLQNVERYAPDGEVEIQTERREDTVATSISDDGPGLPDHAEDLFDGAAPTGNGLGLGLGLSRDLARAMGGDLVVDPPRRRGATFTLLLPHAHEAPERLPAPHLTTPALTPRARLLVDMAATLSEPSLDRTVAGLQNLYASLLGAGDSVLFIPTGPDAFQPIGATAVPRSDLPLRDPWLSQVIRTAEPLIIEDFDSRASAAWHSMIGGNATAFLPVLDLGEPVGVLAVSWASAADLPELQAMAVAEALSQFAAFAIRRAALEDDIAFERGLRSSVMESLPIAISVFAGDPPRVVDWNRRERRMLGINEDGERPNDLGASQHKYEVRFADGTPLTIDNAPVTSAIRTGKSMGPFLLVLRRADGTEITTRTYCAPFFNENGAVAGAVVTSEELDIDAAMLTGGGALGDQVSPLHQAG
jgi:PAS domain-containing protein